MVTIKDFKDDLLSLRDKHILLEKCFEHFLTLSFIEDNQKEFLSCAFYCYNYEQLFEKLLKYCLDITWGAYPKTHKLHKLLEAFIQNSEFRTDKRKYITSLAYITVCAESFRYDDEIDCEAFNEAFCTTKELLRDIIDFIKTIILQQSNFL